jgi:hypothetical protein
MKAKRLVYASLMVFLLTVMIFTTAFAGTVSSGGISLLYPEFPLSGPGLKSCEPWEDSKANTIELSGVPEGANVEVTFVYSSPYTGSPVYQPPVNYYNVSGTLVVPVVYPEDTTNWPVFDASTNERAIAVAALVRINVNGTTVKLVSKQWWVRCLPPVAPAQGCTPGYWRQPHHLDSWLPTGYGPNDSFDTVFGVNASFSPNTLLDAVWLGGGGENALARQAVAGLLNASHPDVNFIYTPAQVIAGVQNAYATNNFEPFKDLLDTANNAGCPLN